MLVAKHDAEQMRHMQTKLAMNYPKAATQRLDTHSANAPEVIAFIRAAKPDIVIARCKHLLKREVYSLPSVGTFVMHPGICPEYRNAHGCFWALARRDLDNVGMTLLKIDDGVDTGPIYGHYKYAFDERQESHVMIQARCVYDNLEALAARLTDIARGGATEVDVAGHKSAVWGQPWMTKYITWKFMAWRRGR